MSAIINSCSIQHETSDNGPNIRDYYGQPFLSLFTSEEEYKKGQFRKIESSSSLPGAFEDFSLALVGTRSPQVSAVATLYGQKSGLGCLRHAGLEIVSYGPQHMPLSECGGFGVVGGHTLLGKHVRRLSANAEGFSLEGVCRLTPRPETSEGGIWLDATQTYSKGKLDLSFAFRQIVERPIMGFSFFGKGKVCRIEGERELRPRTLNRYQGEGRTVTIANAQSMMQIVPTQQHREMHVIPLCGGSDFWGADFLISYILPIEQFDFHWSVVL